jgi:hypothetical protein
LNQKKRIPILTTEQHHFVLKNTTKLTFTNQNDIVGNQNGIDLIDHINHDKLNNSVENLRITNQSGNQQNKA